MPEHVSPGDITVDRLRVRHYASDHPPVWVATLTVGGRRQDIEMPPQEVSRPQALISSVEDTFGVSVTGRAGMTDIAKAQGVEIEPEYALSPRAHARGFDWSFAEEPADGIHKLLGKDDVDAAVATLSIDEADMIEAHCPDTPPDSVQRGELWVDHRAVTDANPDWAYGTMTDELRRLAPDGNLETRAEQASTWTAFRISAEALDEFVSNATK